MSGRCPSEVGLVQLRRSANALNVEHFGNFPIRCLNKRPAHWPEGSSSLRWIASGGEATVFGPCDSCAEDAQGPPPRASCACLRVSYAPVDNGDGSLSERWACDSCGAQFARMVAAAVPKRGERP